MDETRGGRLSRRALLASATSVVASLMVACAGRAPREESGPTTTGPAVRTDGPRQGRIGARPAAPATGAQPVGLQPLGLGAGRDGLLFVPSQAEAGGALPLVLMLHGAGGDARGGLAPFLDGAEAAGVILLAPESRGRTWDVLLGGYGPDVTFIDRALELTFRRYAVDPRRISIEGFSDGASYALGVGLANGDLFRRITAFSPGYVPQFTAEGRPSVFISHGTADDVLPVDRCSRRIVPLLRRRGYIVRYEEFEGGHDVPLDIAADALGAVVEGR